MPTTIIRKTTKVNATAPAATPEYTITSEEDWSGCCCVGFRGTETETDSNIEIVLGNCVLA